MQQFPSASAQLGVWDPVNNLWVPLQGDAAGHLVIGANPSLLVKDETLNDSDKTFAVPAGRVWSVLWIWIRMSTTATVGNREIIVDIRDDTGTVIASLNTGINHAENLIRFYLFAEGLPRETAFFSTDNLYHPTPKISLPPTFDVRVLDSAVVDVAADDMFVYILGVESNA